MSDGLRRRLPRRDDRRSSTALDRDAIEAVAAGLAEVRERGGRLFILGVGGSAGHAATRSTTSASSAASRPTRPPTTSPSSPPAPTTRAGRPRSSAWLARLAARRRRRRAGVLGRRRRRRARASRPTSSGRSTWPTSAAPRSSASSAATAATPRAVADACVVDPAAVRRRGSRPTPRACARSSGTCWSATRRCSAAPTKWESIAVGEPSARRGVRSSSAAPASSAATSSTACSPTGDRAAHRLRQLHLRARVALRRARRTTRGSQVVRGDVERPGRADARRWPATTGDPPRLQPRHRRGDGRPDDRLRRGHAAHPPRGRGDAADRRRGGSPTPRAAASTATSASTRRTRTTGRWSRSRPTARASSPARR